MTKQRSRKGLYTVITGAILSAGIAYFLLAGGDSDAPATEALLATVEIGSIENTIASAGSLKPSDFVDVGAQVSGQLQKLYVEIGDLVEQGQLLAEIDARVQEARVNASRASIEALEAQIIAREADLVLARSNVARQTRLLATDVTSEFDYDSAVNAVTAAEASLFQLQKQIEQSRASLETEETQLEFTRIYAPMSGTVVAIEMEEGRTLNAVQMAPTILRIADLGTMTVEAEISEADIGDIRVGMPVYFTTLGGRQRRWYSEVRQILPTPTVENNVVLYTGLFDIENRDGALLPEMTAQVYFITASAQDVLTVPMGALRFQDRGSARATVNGIATGAPGVQSRPQLNREALGELSPEQRRERIAQFRAQRVGEAPSIDTGRDQSGNQPIARRPRPALVTVVDDLGNQREQQVQIGVTSRISAEVLEGLQAGDRVVAGIIQNAVPGQNPANNRRFRPPF